ncbi:unnamed protein product [Tilletia controversa]|nr:unnamed protein product [Tilletia controversa]
MSEGTDTAERTNQTPDATLAEIAASLRRMESRIGGVENAFVDHQVRLSAIVNAYWTSALHRRDTSIGTERTTERADILLDG